MYYYYTHLSNQFHCLDMLRKLTQSVSVLVDPQWPRCLCQYPETTQSSGLCNCTIPCGRWLHLMSFFSRIAPRVPGLSNISKDWRYQPLRFCQGGGGSHGYSLEPSLICWGSPVCSCGFPKTGVNHVRRLGGALRRVAFPVLPEAAGGGAEPGARGGVGLCVRCFGRGWSSSNQRSWPIDAYV